MQVGSLYEQAVELSPRAARIAATLLVQEPGLPAPLRRSLAIALGALTRGGGDGAGQAHDEGIEPVAPSRSDRDARAAQRFVKACREVCTHP
jgi:hypothetical protein